MSQFANQNSVERNRGSDVLPQDPGLLNQAVGFLNEGKPFLLFGAFHAERSIRNLLLAMG